MRFLPQYLQKNIRLFFYTRGMLNLMLPCSGYTRKLMERYQASATEEKAYVQKRANYYLKVNTPFAVNEQGTSIREFRTTKKHRQKSNFFFDLHEYLRHFDGHLRFMYRFGDNYSIPAMPTFLKARALGCDNANAVLMKLNKVRHFNFVKDRVPFDKKLDRIVWRGNARRPHRQKVVQQFHDHPLCDMGDPGSRTIPGGRKRPYLSIHEQLRCKFVLSIEGNDVATNLKWIMSSQSMAFMTRPTCETWFMEGELIPDHHYVLLRDDYSDLEERIRFYLAHREACHQILKNANGHVAQFLDEDREAMIALYVLDKYFALSGQTPGLGLYTPPTKD